MTLLPLIEDPCCPRCTHTHAKPCRDFVECMNEGPPCHESAECARTIKERAAKMRREPNGKTVNAGGAGTRGPGPGPRRGSPPP